MEVLNKMDITYKDINNTMMIEAPSELSKAKGLQSVKNLMII